MGSRCRLKSVCSPLTPGLMASGEASRQDGRTRSSEAMCMICYEEDIRERHLFPCAHWTCLSCAERCRVCPFCRCPAGDGVAAAPHEELPDSDASWSDRDGDSDVGSVTGTTHSFVDSAADSGEDVDHAEL